MSETLNEKLSQIGDEAYANRDEPIPRDAKVTRGHKRSRTLQVRLNDDEYAALEAAAEEANLPVSTLVRSLVLRELETSDVEADAVHDAVVFDTAVLTALLFSRVAEDHAASFESLLEKLRSEDLVQEKLAAPSFVKAISMMRNDLVHGNASYEVKQQRRPAAKQRRVKRRPEPVEMIDKIGAELDELRAAVAESADA
jgi:mobilization protein NikA